MENCITEDEQKSLLNFQEKCEMPEWLLAKKAIPFRRPKNYFDDSPEETMEEIPKETMEEIPKETSKEISKETLKEIDSIIARSWMRSNACDFTPPSWKIASKDNILIQCFQVYQNILVNSGYSVSKDENIFAVTLRDQNKHSHLCVRIVVCPDTLYSEGKFFSTLLEKYFPFHDENQHTKKFSTIEELMDYLGLLPRFFLEDK
jgi:hypothetical protein